MELTEKIETINELLTEHFGIDTVNGLPIWRVVWSEDQFEKRLGVYDDITPSGIYLRTVTEVREVPKYRQWIKERYVLERLVLVPDSNKSDLPTQKLSYEPMWVFENGAGTALPPKFDVCKIVIDTVYAALGKAGLSKYKDPRSDEADPEIAIAKQKARIDKLCEEMFGDESGLGGSLVHREGIAMPQEYGKIKEN